MDVKVLHITNSFHQGGSERQAVQLVRLLKREGTFDVYLACLNDDGVLRKEVDDFTDIREYKLKSFFDPSFLFRAHECSKYIRENGIDIVHTHDFYTNVFGMTAAALARVKTKIASKRETGSMRSASQKLIEKQAFRTASAIVVNAEAVKNYLTDDGVNAGKITVVYNGLNLARLMPDPDLSRSDILKKLNLPEGRRFVTLVANLRHEVKNQPMLIRAAKIVRERVPDSAFVFAGEGEQLDSLKQLAAYLEVSADCYFTGRCENVPELLSVSSIGALTSFNEGFSNSILEYMAAALPVVATNVGGAAEAVLEGETGFLVASDDHAALAEKLIELLNGPEKAGEMGRAGRRRVEENFSLEAQLKNTIELYQSFESRL